MRRRVGSVALVVALACVGQAGSSAEDATSPAQPSAEEAKALTALKRRVGEWMAARRGLLDECPNCNGSGRITSVVGPRAVARTCGRCEGAGKAFSKVLGRKLLYDLRSPAWRLRPNAQAEADAEFKALRIADGARLCPKSWTWERGELVDADHAIAYVFEGADSVARPSQWILATDPRTKAATWFLWMEVADGRWPDPTTGPAGNPAAPPAGEPIPQLQDILVEGALRKAPLQFTVTKREHAATVLRLALALPDVPPASRIDGMVVTDAIAVVRAVWPALKSDWTDVRLTFDAPHQDRFGERKPLTLWTVSMAYATFERIHWDNLSDGDAFALFQATREEHEGWTPVTR